jgi:DNA gyrase subunit A
VRGAQLRGDDVVEHFFVTTTHHWLLFFTNFGRVYRAKAYELPEAGRDAKGQHVANLLAFQPDEKHRAGAGASGLRGAPYLVLATKHGLVKKTRPWRSTTPRAAADSSRSTCATATSWSAPRWCEASRRPAAGLPQGQSLRFHADDETLRPMGRATSGVTGMKFRGPATRCCPCLVVQDGTDPDVFVVFESGLAKRTPGLGLPRQGPRHPRGGASPRSRSDKGGDLVGALTVDEATRSWSSWRRARSCARGWTRYAVTGRNTMGVQFAKPDRGDAIVAVARNAERTVEN